MVARDLNSMGSDSRNRAGNARSFKSVNGSEFHGERREEKEKNGRA